MEFINELAPQLLSSVSILGYILVFAAGIITSIGPCNLSIMPILIAYVGGSEIGRKRGFALSCFFTLGTAVTFMLLGMIIAAVGGIFGTSQSFIYYFVAAICLIIGLNLTGVLKFNINFGGSLLNRTGEKKGIWGSFLLGMVMGLVGSQCGTPILLIILTLAFASGQWLYGTTLLFVYALGRGVPLVVAGTFTSLLTRMEFFARLSSTLDKAAGFIIIIMGLYFAWLA